MPYRRPQLAAFTLLEVTIAMLLVAILSAFAYYAFSTFTRLLSDQQVQKKDHYAFDLFRHRMKIDSYEADSIFLDQDMLRLKDSVGYINYTFLDSLILREQYALRTDSFFMSYGAPQYNYVTNGNFESDLIQSYTIPLQINGKTVPLHIYKQYSSLQLTGVIPIE